MSRWWTCTLTIQSRARMLDKFTSHSNMTIKIPHLYLKLFRYLKFFLSQFSFNNYFSLKAKEVPAKDIGGTSDPYCRVTLLPDKKHRLETKIKRRTLHPRWNETFYFEGFPLQKLQSRVLHLHVFDYDRFSRDDSIG